MRFSRHSFMLAVGTSWLLPGCNPSSYEPPETPLIALTPTEYNNTVRDLLGMPDDGYDWPDAPEIASRLTADQGEPAGLFGITPLLPPPWPWPFPEEIGVDGFEGMAEGQESSAYLMEELQKSAMHFAAYTLVSDLFFDCEDWYSLPEDEQFACGWSSVERFTQRAWRRPLEEQEATRLQLFWERNRLQGTPEEAVVVTIGGILQSPQFLFRVERGDPEAAVDGVIPLTDWEMASRLSYLLWDSMPDAPLFEAAANGELSSEEGVRTQFRRMFYDPRTEAAVVQFHHQWLGTDDVLGISPARSSFGPLYGLTPEPALDTTDDGEWPSVLGPVRHSMKAEVHLFVRDVIFQGQGTLEALLTDNKGYLSSYTEPLYGSGAVLDDTEKVYWPFGNIVFSLPVQDVLTLSHATFPATERAGLLTMPAVLGLGAYPVHPAPILRGKRVMERLTCTEFGAPPPGAEGAAPADTEEATDTNRLRTETITSPAECAVCHETLNPPGFAFENYDAMGRWRTEDNGFPVDASGNFSLSGGETFSFTDGVDLAKQLATSTQVRECYALQWTRYATGEHLDRDDERIATLLSDFQSNDHVGMLLEAVVLSDIFRTLHVEETQP